MFDKAAAETGSQVLMMEGWCAHAHAGNMKTNPISSVLQRNGLSEGLGRDVVGASVALEKSREFALHILQLVEVTHTQTHRSCAGEVLLLSRIACQRRPPTPRLGADTPPMLKCPAELPYPIKGQYTTHHNTPSMGCDTGQTFESGAKKCDEKKQASIVTKYVCLQCHGMRLLSLCLFVRA